MPVRVVQELHENLVDRSREVVAELGEPFADIYQWAVKNDLQPQLITTYYILGLNPVLVGIGNLVRELNYQDSLIITEQWKDNLETRQLAQFAVAVNADAEMVRSYSHISHDGGAVQNRRQYEGLQDKTFLLALLTHPLSDTVDKKTYIERRRLRVWLTVQASIRFQKYSSPADRNISAAARFLIMDADDPRWVLVDKLLNRVKQNLGSSDNTFERFSGSLANTAERIRNDGNDRSRSEVIFLNAIVAIAREETDPIAYNIGHIVNFPLVVSQSNPTIIDDILQTGKPDDVLPQTLIPSVFDDSDEPTLSYLTEVDATDTSAEQALSSGSVFMQTMEMSHYLPWSWERIFPSEFELLEQWLEAALQSDDAENRTGAALVWLALQLGRSLFMVERITLEAEITNEWSFTLNFQQLKRKSPRRSSVWRPDDAAIDRLRPFVDELIVTVPETIQRALQAYVSERTESGNSNSLGQIWLQVSEDKLDVWFAEQARQHFPRLTSAKLANYKSQQLFDSNGEFNFARLLTSHPSSALPGACSYATWDVKAIENGLGLEVQTNGAEIDTLIMGSLLAPLDSVLKEEIVRCTNLLQEKVTEGWVNYHNTLAQYVVMALYAATGARPLRDPFESLSYFSIQHACVFINDKSDDGLHNGRVVPLPATAIVLVQEYTSSLKKLSKELVTHSPKLANNIKMLSDGNQGAEMPLFFLLDADLQWYSMADAPKLGCSLFEWGLPANLFRHRYSQRLLHKGVDPEVIDGWMGHAERGTATYSDYSARCWKQDAKIYSEALQQSFNVLPFKIPEAPSEQLKFLSVPSNPTNELKTKIFGYKAREKNRRLRVKAAINDAQTDIEIYLNDRAINTLDEDQLKQLISKMLLRDNRIPQPQAALRYKVLLKQLRKAEEKEKQSENINPVRNQLLRQRLVKQQEERSLVTDKVISSLEHYQELLDWAHRTKSNTFQGRVVKSASLLIGTLILAIENRLSYQRLLLDIVNSKNFRLVQNNKTLYLEYSEVLLKDDLGAAVQRHQISYKVASFFAYGSHNKKNVRVPTPANIPELNELLTIYRKENLTQKNPTVEELVAWLSHLINQANLVQLPGIVAAALSERMPPTSESLPDHMRLLEGRLIDLPKQVAEVSYHDIGITRARGQENDKQVLQEKAKEMTSEIGLLLQSYSPSQARTYAKKIHLVCKQYKGQVSPAVLMLGYWMAELMASGKAARRKNILPYAKNTLTTYWSSLVHVFRGLLYKADLVIMESDELTELCAQMLEYKQGARVDYFAKRLQDFFRWAAGYGTATPEWAELAIVNDERSVSTGLISEDDYQACLAKIMSDIELDQDKQLMLSSVLLLCYRFGLRSQEAIGLLRRDWCQSATDESIWVLVQNNHYRTLKSHSSRRAIPLLFKLSCIENDIIERTLGRYSGIAGTAVNRPLLCEPSNVGGQPALTSLAPRIPETLILLLRSVTGNPKLVLHHARHSFYNRVAAALFGLKMPLANKLTHPEEHEYIRRVVLGTNSSVSRRSSMALARLMGHRYPSTGLKSYFHLASAWADELVTVSQKRVSRLEAAIQVTELPRLQKAQEDAPLAQTLQYVKPTLSKTIQTLRLVALGISYARASRLMRISPSFIENLQMVFETTNERMRFTSSLDKRVKLKGQLCPNALLESIGDDAWQRMLYQAEKIDSQNQLVLDGIEIAHLEELPYMVSTNRQVLMEQSGQCMLVGHVLELFEIPESGYQVRVKNTSTLAMGRLQEAGFSALYEEEARRKLDGFTVYLVGRGGTQYQLRDYGGLVIERLEKGVIRNGLELAVAVLAIGVLAIHNS